MQKIYSRPRIVFPKIDLKNRNKIKKVILIFPIILIAICTAINISNTILPIYYDLCSNKAKEIGTIISNEESTKVMLDYNYEDLFLIDKDKNNEIKMIKSNMITINEITSNIAKNIQVKLEGKDEEEIKIKLGSIINFPLVSGMGPDIKISILPIGNVETNLKSEFTTQGINQTLHRVYLEVKCEVEIISSLDNINEEIINQVLLMENIIIGEIPTNFYNLEGLGITDTLEMIE